MILVTGGTGLLGSQVVRDLVTAGKPVRVTKRKNSDMSFVKDIVNQVEWVNADVENLSALENAFQGIDDVIHTAGFVSYYKKDKQKLLDVNYIGTRNVVQTCLNQGIRKLIHVSSISALGSTNQSDDQEVDEQLQNKSEAFTSNYGQSKYLGELEVWRGITEGLSAVIVNPSVILGYHNWNQGSCQLFKRVYDGWNFYTMGQTGYVSVQDMSSIMVQLLASDIENERYIVSAENLPIKTIFEYIADGFSVTAPSKKIDPKYSGIIKFLENISAAVQFKKPLLTKETLRMANEQRIYKNGKIKEALNFEFESLPEACARICAEYLAKIPS